MKSIQIANWTIVSITWNKEDLRILKPMRVIYKYTIAYFMGRNGYVVVHGSLFMARNGQFGNLTGGYYRSPVSRTVSQASYVFRRTAPIVFRSGKVVLTRGKTAQFLQSDTRKSAFRNSYNPSESESSNDYYYFLIEISNKINNFPLLMKFKLFNRIYTKKIK